jgi:O-antigen/teichoic acid export membrane protein
MAIAQRIFKNSFFLFSGQIVAKLINFLLILLLTRIFSEEDFGIFSYTLAYTGMFMILCNLGLNTLVIRDIAKDRSCARQIVEDMFPIIFYLSFVSLILMNGIAWLSGWPAYERMIILLLSFYVVFDAFSRSFISVMRAYERMEFESAINILERIFLIILTILIGIFNLSLTILVLSFMAAELIKVIISVAIVKNKLVNFNIKFHTVNYLSLIKNALPFALMAIFTTISMRIDTVMIKIFHSSELSGVYNIAHKIIDSITFIPENIYYAFFPVLASLYIIDRNKFTYTFLKALKLISLLAIPVSCFLYFWASDIISLLFEPRYFTAYIALKWLALAVGALFIKYAVAVVMNVIGKQHLFSMYVGISMILNILLNLLLIPKYGIVGAGIATISSESITTITGLISLRNLLPINKIGIYAFRFIVSIALLSLFMYIIKEIPLYFAIPSAFLVYIFLLFIIKLVKFDDLAYIKQLLHARIKSEV